MAGILNMRANNLWEEVRNLLYDHSLIKNLGKSGKLPSYIPPRAFALALFDLVAPVSGSATTRTLQDIRSSVSTISNEQVKNALVALIDDAGDDLKKARKNVERWYDDAMERVSGWYKRKPQVFILVWTLAVTLSVNADTILIASTPAHDATLRASLVAMAEVTAKETLPQNAEQAMDRIKQMSIETEKLGAANWMVA